MRRNIFLVAIIFANFSDLASVVASNIEPQRPYGFNYEVRKSEWLNQELQQIRFYDKKSGELIDQLFVIRPQDSQKKSDLKFRTYLEAERTCKALKPVDALAEVENLETRFSIPADHLMFFLVDENLITIDRSTGENSLAEGASGKIYPFWTQGTIEPGAMSLFKLDSMAGYLVGKVYTTGYMFGFSDLEKIPERQNALRAKIATFETKRNDVKQALLRESEQEDYLKEAHQKQIEKLNEKIRDLKRELTLLTVDLEGLELHCAAGSRLEASHFQGPLSGQLMEMAASRLGSE